MESPSPFPHKKNPKPNEVHLQCTSLFLESAGVTDMSLRQALHLPHFLQNSFCSTGIMCRVTDDGSKCQPLFAFTLNKGVYSASNRQTNILRKLRMVPLETFCDTLIELLKLQHKRKSKVMLLKTALWIFSCSGGTQCMWLVDQSRKTCQCLKELHKCHHTW